MFSDELLPINIHRLHHCFILLSSVRVCSGFCVNVPYLNRKIFIQGIEIYIIAVGIK